MARKKLNQVQMYTEQTTGVRLSSHERLCSERMKQLIKSIDELGKDVKEMKADMNKWKGAGSIIILIGSFIASVFYFFME
jgi:phage shock protein A